MDERRRINLRKRRKQLLMIGTVTGITVMLVIVGVFFGVIAGMGQWPDGQSIALVFGLDEKDPEQPGDADAAGTEHGNKDGSGVDLVQVENGQTNTEPSTEPLQPSSFAQQFADASDNTGSESGEDGTQTAVRTETQTEQQTEPQIAASVAVQLTETPTASVHLVAFGDNLMHRSVSLSGLQADGSYNYDYNFCHVTGLIQSADLAVINQETVIGGNELGIQGYPCFNGRTEMADELAKVGFDVVLGANNHILDQGAGAVIHMVQYFKTHYPQITLLGIHDSWESRDEVAVVECQGIRIAMINYTDLLNIPSALTGQEYLTDYLDYDRLAALIQKAKASSDFVIVFPHWGTEYELGTDAKQQQETAFLAQQGVDLVIGTHPHVVEPVEMVARPDGGKMLVYYSLGNFQSIQNKESKIIGGMADVMIEKSRYGTKISDFNMQFLATDYRITGGLRDYYNEVTTYRFEDYSRDLAAGSWVFNDNPNFNLDYMYQLQAQMEVQVHQQRQAAGLE